MAKLYHKMKYHAQTSPSRPSILANVFAMSWQAEICVLTLGVMGSWNVSFFNREGCGASKKQISKKIFNIYEPLYLDDIPSQTAKVLSAKSKIEEGSNGGDKQALIF